MLDDADLAETVRGLSWASLLDNGQTCYLSSRILAPRTRYDEVVDAVADLARSLRVGDPLAPTARVGPLVTQQQRERVEGFITAGRAEGARVVAGGGRPKDLDRGWYIEPPSLLTWPRTPPRSGRRSSGPCSLSSRTTTSTTR